VCDLLELGKHRLPDDRPSNVTQSESVPLVDAIRFTIGCPLIFTGAVSTSERNTSTSGRPDASR
jgi:hypothetical protein